MRSQFRSFTLGVVVSLMLAAPAIAGPTIANGGFEQTTLGAVGALCSTGLTNFNDGCQVLAATGWTNSDGYSFVNNNNSVGRGFDQGGGKDPTLMLYGVTPSPAGGNFLAVDGDSSVMYRGSISQTVTGLSVGSNYAISFYQAGSEQSPDSTPTTEQWQVSLGGSTQTSGLLTNAAASFTGWSSQTLVFGATATSELLTFVALGNPTGAPPFVLLDGVSVAVVPEPAAYALFATALLGLLVVGRRRSLARTRG
jgi:hypothetical protein